MVSWFVFSLLLIYYCKEFVHCEYDLQVTFYSFSNPNGKLIKRNRCCDDQGGRQCSEDVCDSFFSFCLRSIDAPVNRTNEDTNIEEICSNTDIISTPTMTDINSAMLFNSSYVLPNHGPLGSMNGIQFYLELLDHDSTKNDLIDRFAINISDSMNSFIERANYSGIFGVAMLEVSFYIINNRPTTESSPTVVTSTESGPTTESSPTVTSTESGTTAVNSTEGGTSTVTSCEYDLQVTFYSFSNPNGKLIKRNRCCDDQRGRQCSDDVCDSFFSFCLRSVDEPVSRTDEDTNIEEICSNTTIISTPTMTDINSAMLYNSTYVLPYPYGPLWSMNGTQFYLELLDYDSTKNDLIDRFAINISDSMNSFIERANYSGIFRVAMLEVSFYIINNCPTTESSPTAANSTESDPTTESSPTVTSTEGGTSTVNSTESGTAMVTSTEITLTDVDNGYELLVTINSYGNPSHECAGCTKCCDGACNRGCDTYFYLCVRPFQTTFPESPMIIRRDCPPDEVVVTENERNRIDGTTFNDTVLGVPNPIIFSKIANPMEGVQLYLEMIDFDPNNEDDLIDRFIINVTVPIGSSITELNVTGIFGFAEISVSFEARCKSGYTCKSVEADSSNIGVILGSFSGVILLIILLIIVLSMVVCIVMITRKSKSQSSLPVNVSSSNELTSYSEKGLDINKEDDTTEQKQNVRYVKPGTITIESHMESKQDNAIEYELKNYEYETPLDAMESKMLYIYDLLESVDDYDYEIPFWNPSNEEKELIAQFKKLRIRGFSGRELQINAILGSGAFGTVHKGVWHHSEGDESVEEEVAVKSIENGASNEERVKFLQEAAIMGQFNHPNIVKIIGILMTESECKIIVELMLKGDLLNLLPKLKSSSDNHSELASQLLYYSRQVASGMSYLGLKGYVHRDLAARNILVSDDDICKIGDFGLSRDLKEEEFYVSHGGKVPVKWTAPEAIHCRKYSTASDVWSYGCVLYEIWTLGIKPYHHLTNGQVIKEIAKGYRLAPPPGCPRVIYETMIKCWNSNPDSRPEFYEICSMLSLPEYKILKWSPEDSEAYSEQARTIGAPLNEGKNMFVQLQETYIICY